VTILLSEARTEAPDAGEDENVFKTLNFTDEHGFKKFANANDESNFDNGDEVLEGLADVTERFFQIFVEETLKVTLALGIVLLLSSDPGLNVSLPLVAIGVRDIENTGTGDSGRGGELQVTNLENETHVRLQHNTFVRGEGENLVVIHDRVHGLNPVGIEITIKDNPLGVVVLQLGKRTEGLRHESINPLTSLNMHNTVKFVGGNDLGVKINNSSLFTVEILSLRKSLPGRGFTSTGGTHSENAMTNNQELTKLHNLKNEVLIGAELLLVDGLLDHAFETHVTGTRHNDTGEEI